jgi:hypothetical protein
MTRGHRSWFQDLINVWTMPANMLKNKVKYRQFIHWCEWRCLTTSCIFLHTKHIVPRCRPPDRQPTTTTGHHNTFCNLQSYAPDDGQMFVRNMLSWSWRSINSVICCI